jgi:4-hydroxybenzoate polyprenyltransferase
LVSTALVGTALSALILTAAAWQLGPLPFALLPGAAVFLVGYSWTKRFTWLSHFVLGFTDGLAPMGAWAAVRGSLFTVGDLPAWLLLGAVTTWIGGFDLIYACQDVAFDRREGLHSIPARFGVAAGLRVSIACHVVTTALLLWLGTRVGLSWPYWLGMLVVTGLLAYEHSLVHPDDLSRVNVAFFNVNGYISVTLLVSVLAALSV